MRELTIHDYRTMLAESEIRESQTKASITDYMNICEDLSRKLEEARHRIAELEQQVIFHKEIADAREFDFHEAEKRIAAFEFALTPSEETKFAYIGGAVNFWHTDFDENGGEHRIRLDVPWTSIKELMKLIRQKADERAARNKPEGTTI